MKRFIYLDTELVNSIIAQHYKGLVLQTSTERKDSQSTVRSTNVKIGGKTEAAGGIPALAKIAGEISAGLRASSENNNHSVLREIETRTLHDAAFDIAYEIVRENYGFEFGDYSSGTYVKFESAFTFVDFNYIEALFTADGIMQFIKQAGKKAIEEEMATALNRTQQRKANNKEVKKRVADNDQQYDDISTMIKALKSVIPYSRMLISYDGFLIPLEDRYFRDNPNTIGFKHGGEVTCMGYITNIIGKDTLPDNTDIFATLQHQINEALRAVLPTEEDNLVVVHPIALYHGR